MIFSLLFLIFFACEEVKSQDQEVKEVDLRQRVRVQLLTTQSFSQEFVLEAKIEAAQYAVLVPKSAGRVSTVHVRIGDVVAENDVLLAVEEKDYREGFREAKANHALVDIQLSHAKKQHERFQTLQKEGAATQAQLEEIEMAVELAQGQLRRASAGLNIAKSRLEGCKVKAPFSGAIIARNIEVGEMIGGPTQRPPLMLADLERLRVIAEVDEQRAQLLQIGNAITILRGTEKIAATISRINGAVDPVVHTVRIEAELKNTKKSIRHGEAAKISIQTEASTAVSVPRTSLLEARSGRANVFVLASDGVVEKREIRYGRSNVDHVPVFDGVEEGERILISGHTRLSDGARVLVVED